MIKFEEYFIGQKAEITEKFTAEKILKFAELTGDFNPIHLDEQYCERTHFKKPIVHGTYVTSVIGTILGTKLPGLGTILVLQEHRFIKPVFVGEIITLVVKIKELKYDRKIIILDIECINEVNEIVVVGKAITKKIY